MVVAVLLALLVGAGGGWALASTRDDEDQVSSPAPITVSPVPATPSVPVVVVSPDPDDPPLEPGIDLTDVRLAVPPAPGAATPSPDEPPAAVTLPVPVGWEQAFDGVSSWKYTMPGNGENSFGLRIEIVADQGESVSSALRGRAAELESAQAQGNMGDLVVEPTPTADGFTATFIDVNSYRRVSIERFFDGPDGLAYATVAGFGRVGDRTGLEDLVARITSGLSTAQNG